MLGPSVGGGIALFGGGLLLGWTENPSARSWLGNVNLQPWQLAFFVVGLPGLLLALIVALTLREPVRRGCGQQNANDTPPMRAVLHELLVTHRFAIPYFLGYVALILLFYTHSAWFPTLLIRKFGLHASEVGRMVGPVYMLGGIAGVTCAGLLAGRFRDEDALKKVLQLAACAAGLLVPAACAVALVPSVSGALALYGLCAFAASIVMALAPLPIQIALPNRMRGRAIALLVFLTNIISGGLGPFSVGWLTERIADKSAGLSVALATVGTSAALASTLLYWIAARRVPDVAPNA
jgi:hypothetical protein